MLAFHLPPLTTQRFFEFPDDKPSLWFCAKRLIKRSAPYFTISLVGLVCVGLLVQHTALMKDLIVYKMHFYLGDLCNLVFSAGVALAVRKIYYEETYQGRDRRIAFPNISKPRASKKSLPRISPSAAYAASHYSAPSFWSEICGKLPHTILIALAGGYVHLVSWYRILNQGTAVIMAFTMLGIGIKLALQEVSKWFILKKGIRSIRTMCVLVGVPTVLIDTQARIVLIGTQSNSFLIRGTFGMAVAEITLRAVKAAFVAWNIRRRATILGESCQDASSEYATSKEHRQPPPNLEFQLWRRQILAYHTAEITADTYAEYIAIGCSQSITFWFVGHPLYPALQLDTGIGGGPLSELNTARWRINQVGMLAFQFIVEIFVDYICVVMEMAAGIDFDRIQDLSSFLGVLFMTMAVISICISSAVYLCTP
ncbi:unnamed protein product [Phytophthora lilii]|uniref:Unnamed protein product n=1 Tax=Phytophthora lilii TaxID=2077276 RepID=A0A9W6WPG5_9STRA|nr:unnamed protein product [Phytophthora lilii]